MGDRFVTRARCQAGTSLVEVLVAMVLLAIGAMAVAPVFVSSMKRNAASADVSSLGAAATSRMELLSNVPAYSLVAGGSLTSNVAGYSDTSDPAVVVRWQIVDGGGPAGVRTIRTIAIATRQIYARQESVQLVTLRGR
jgi:prepilin-type N-terminal cleavage/methylation domain-containing protein